MRKLTTKEKIQPLIRFCIFLVLLYFSYYETGWATSTLFFLIFSSNELEIFLKKKGIA